MESKLLSALSMAENGQMSRFSALRAMGLGRDKKSFSALSKAIDALTEEGRVQKIGGHSVCLSGDMKRKSGEGIDNHAAKFLRLGFDQVVEAAATLTTSFGDGANEYYLESIEEKKSEKNGNAIEAIELKSLNHQELEKGDVIQMRLGRNRPTKNWLVEDVSPQSLALSKLKKHAYVTDIYERVLGQGRGAIALPAKENWAAAKKKYQDEVNKVMFINDVETKDDGEIDDGIDAAFETLKTDIEEFRKLQKKLEEFKKTVEGIQVMKLTLPQMETTTVTIPAHKLVKIQEEGGEEGGEGGEGGQEGKGNSSAIWFRFHPPHSLSEKVSKKVEVGEVKLVEGTSKEKIVVYVKDQDSRNGWIETHILETGNEKKDVIPDRPYEFETPMGKCSVYLNPDQKKVLHVKLKEGVTVLNEAR